MNNPASLPACLLDSGIYVRWRWFSSLAASRTNSGMHVSSIQSIESNISSPFYRPELNAPILAWLQLEVGNYDRDPQLTVLNINNHNAGLFWQEMRLNLAVLVTSEKCDFGELFDLNPVVSSWVDSLPNRSLNRRIEPTTRTSSITNFSNKSDF